MSEEELAAAIASDPDTFILSEEKLARGRMVFPDGRAVLRVPVNKEDADWLAQHQVDSAQLAGVVHDYIRSHQ